jgi:hypothetical protein
METVKRVEELVRKIAESPLSESIDSKSFASKLVGREVNDGWVITKAEVDEKDNDLVNITLEKTFAPVRFISQKMVIKLEGEE